VSRLSGKVAFVTGAASGIGRAIAVIFAANGARVVIADLNEEGAAETVRLVTGAGGDAAAFTTDVTSEEAVRDAIDACVRDFGSLDVLVNNAGAVKMASAAETELADWERMLAVNLRGVFLTTKHAIPHMERNEGGVIVNIASIGSIVSVPAHAAYNAAKAGVVGFSRQVAADYGPRNIRVNCICPTATDTPLVREAGATGGMLRRMADGHPLRRLPTPDDIAYAALFLASDESRCITGVTLPVDSGWTVI
jgi:NAD(P)-dependent dehydrogenase (short-subunit alcohol dehydrogenase family)